MPIGEMVLLPATSTPADIQRAVAEHGYSRYILTDDDGEPAGYLHLKDVMDLTTPEKFARPVPAKRIRDSPRPSAAANSRTPSRPCAAPAPTWPGFSTLPGIPPVCCSWRTSSKNSWAKYRTPPVPE